MAVAGGAVEEAVEGELPDEAPDWAPDELDVRPGRKSVGWPDAGAAFAGEDPEGAAPLPVFPRCAPGWPLVWPFV